VIRTPAPRESPAGLGAVSGQVLRADTGAPVEGATVVLAVGGSGQPPETVTDAQGCYTLGGVPAEQVAVVARAEELGLAPRGCSNIDVEAGAVAQARPIKLQGGGWVSGRVILAGPTSPSPEWGAVTAELVGDPVRFVSVQRKMEPDGSFRTGCLPPGTYRLTATVLVGPSTRPGQEWTGEVGDVVVRAGAEATDTTITVKPPSAS